MAVQNVQIGAVWGSYGSLEVIRNHPQFDRAHIIIIIIIEIAH